MNSHENHMGTNFISAQQICPSFTFLLCFLYAYLRDWGNFVIPSNSLLIVLYRSQIL